MAKKQQNWLWSLSKLFLFWLWLTTLILAGGGLAGGLAGAWSTPLLFFVALSTVFQGTMIPYAVGTLIAVLLMTVLLTAGWVIREWYERTRVESAYAENKEEQTEAAKFKEIELIEVNQFTNQLTSENTNQGSDVKEFNTPTSDLTILHARGNSPSYQTETPTTPPPDFSLSSFDNTPSPSATDSQLTSSSLPLVGAQSPEKKPFNLQAALAAPQKPKEGFKPLQIMQFNPSPEVEIQTYTSNSSPTTPPPSFLNLTTPSPIERENNNHDGTIDQIDEGTMLSLPLASVTAKGNTLREPENSPSKLPSQPLVEKQIPASPITPLAQVIQKNPHPFGSVFSSDADKENSYPMSNDKRSPSPIKTVSSQETPPPSFDLNSGEDGTPPPNFGDFLRADSSIESTTPPPAQLVL